MAEHPQNIRPARTAERRHNSRRHDAESRPEDGQSANRSYRGSHHAERHHRAAEDSRANHRSSDRHHNEHSGHGVR